MKNVGSIAYPDEELLAVARSLAEAENVRIVIGIWDDGAVRNPMLLPATHDVVRDPAFTHRMLVLPSGYCTRID
jgi:hypothetical protein